MVQKKMIKNLLVSGYDVIPEYDYENLILYGNNRDAVSDSQEYIADGCSWQLFYLYGSVGLGKTHLAHAMANQFLERNPRASVRYILIETLISELVAALHDEKQGEQHKVEQLSGKYGQETDFLILDDIQYLEGKPGTGEFVAEILKQRMESGKKTVIISDRTVECQMEQIPAFSECLQKSYCAELKKPDDGERLDILQKLSVKDSVLKDFKFPEETLEEAAAASDGDIRSLRGSLLKLAVYHLLNQGEKTVYKNN